MKLPSKEHPLELLETADAIADHSLYKYREENVGKLTSSDLKRYQNANDHAKTRHTASNFIHVSYIIYYVDIWSQKVQNSVFYNAFHSIDDLNQA